MRLAFAILLALAGSLLAGSAVAVAVADWARGDESYILAFMAVPLASLVALVPFLVAGTRPVPARAVNRVALALVLLLGILFVAGGVVELAANGTMQSAWRGIQLIVAILGSVLAVVAVQWLVFRIRARGAAPAVPRFGRGAGPA